VSTLFSALHTASAALQVFTQTLGVDQQNVANISTPGYAAQRATINPIDLSGAGGGQDSVTITSSSNLFADASVQAASSSSTYSQTSAQKLSPVNQLFDITGASGILAAFQKFSTAFANVSVNPNDSSLRQAAISAAGTVGSAFQTVAASLDTQSAQVASGIQSTTQQINNLSDKIRGLNVQISNEAQIDPGTDASLRSSLDQLSSLVDITVNRDANGRVSVLAGGQLPLVIGDQSYKLSVDPSAAPGAQVSSSVGGHSPASFSGQLGALLDTKNNVIDSLLGSSTTTGTLNTLATGLAIRVNSLLTAGTDANGAVGVPLFTFDSANPANSARTLAIDPAVTPAQLGLASAGASASSNGIANSLASLTGSTAAGDQIAGLSAEGLFSSIASSVGQQLSDANAASTTGQTDLTQAQANRDQAIGVSLDLEAVNITASQRAYQANSQIVTAIDQLTQTALNLIPASSG
jgi:flagellar hook-associated protein 1 FlgK